MSLPTIIIPSNRNLRNSRASLESAIIYAEKTGCRLVITDNSADPEKWQHFHGSSPRLTYIDTTGFEAQKNLLTALAEVETPFFQPMGDDDEIYCLDGQERFDYCRVPADVIGVRPVAATWSLDNGIHRLERYCVAQEHSDQRLEGFIDAAPRYNNIFYSAFRTTLFRDLILAFDSSHPTRGAYCDWTLTICLIAAGKILHDPSTLFRYDLGRWADRDSLDRSTLDLYMKAGLPALAEKYWAILRFADTHGMLAWKGLPLHEQERHRAMTVNARVLLTYFMQEVQKDPEKWSSSARVFVQRMATVSTPDQAYELALPVIDELKPGLGEKYAVFRQAIAA